MRLKSHSRVWTQPNIPQVFESGPGGLRLVTADFEKERERMVHSLIREGLLRSSGVIAAMRKVPREMFVPERLRPYAYSDTPLPTEHGQTISAPHGTVLPGVTWSP